MKDIVKRSDFTSGDHGKSQIFEFCSERTNPDTGERQSKL